MNSMNQRPPQLLRSWGVWAVSMAALALGLVFLQIALPSFDAKPSTATQIGEIAGEIKRAAWRSFFGLSQAKVEPEAPKLVHYLAIIAPIAAIAALILSLVSRLSHENWRLGAYGASMATAALIFQFVWWLALLIIGFLLLASILENIGDIFSW
ncbi:hypothetical protein SAMN05421666_3179 [Roseovarius nanhaiticus]|uniref:Uncharacterized protein n=1 Tax=Roseovarius nanhaiticus TaxID=573024 RepID=A0A1N7HIZ1_9RHOB|nr:hypothetical protein [Roseovarius nanhaiticus]SEK91178.1 hypothetical protein SAMN05216208_2137 [Roseovarius nanhaiticus]SIS24782.1 hypothetical protein SAMN05421666_3179 [Roseovarius nanhaiticus]